MIRLACPLDRTPLEVNDRAAQCPTCRAEYDCREGIWRFLLQPERYQRFLDQYQAVRRAELWGSADPSYYRNLPCVSANDPHREVWRVRAVNFRALLNVIGNQGRVLDVGAGNGWLTFQLAQKGFDVAAVDINDDSTDGLGATRNYPISLDCHQADFDALPFADSQFDFVIYNASFHYARSLQATLREGIRILGENGSIIIMDSPTYRHRADGESMLSARRERFRTHYGFDVVDDAVGFLTFDELHDLEKTFGLHWLWIEPGVSAGWKMRHLLARLKGNREPAHFGLLVGQMNHDLSHRELMRD